MSTKSPHTTPRGRSVIPLGALQHLDKPMLLSLLKASFPPPRGHHAGRSAALHFLSEEELRQRISSGTVTVGWSRVSRWLKTPPDPKDAPLRGLSQREWIMDCRVLELSQRGTSRRMQSSESPGPRLPGDIDRQHDRRGWSHPPASVLQPLNCYKVRAGSEPVVFMGPVVDLCQLASSQVAQLKSPAGSLPSPQHADCPLASLPERSLWSPPLSSQNSSTGRTSTPSPPERPHIQVVHPHDTHIPPPPSAPVVSEVVHVSTSLTSIQCLVDYPSDSDSDADTSTHAPEESSPLSVQQSSAPQLRPPEVGKLAMEEDGDGRLAEQATASAALPRGSSSSIEHDSTSSEESSSEEEEESSPSDGDADEYPSSSRQPSSPLVAYESTSADEGQFSAYGTFSFEDRERTSAEHMGDDSVRWQDVDGRPRSSDLGHHAPSDSGSDHSRPDGSRETLVDSTLRSYNFAPFWQGVGRLAVFGEDRTCVQDDGQPLRTVDVLPDVPMCFDPVRRIFTMRSNELVNALVRTMHAREAFWYLSVPIIIDGIRRRRRLAYVDATSTQVTMRPIVDVELHLLDPAASAALLDGVRLGVNYMVEYSFEPAVEDTPRSQASAHTSAEESASESEALRVASPANLTDSSAVERDTRSDASVSAQSDPEPEAVGTVLHAYTPQQRTRALTRWLYRARGGQFARSPLLQQIRGAPRQASQQAATLLAWTKFAREVYTSGPADDTADPPARGQAITKRAVGDFLRRGHDWVKHALCAQALIDSGHPRVSELIELLVIKSSMLGAKTLANLCTFAKERNKVPAIPLRGRPPMTDPGSDSDYVPPPPKQRAAPGHRSVSNYANVRLDARRSPRSPPPRINRPPAPRPANGKHRGHKSRPAAALGVDAHERHKPLEDDLTDRDGEGETDRSGSVGGQTGAPMATTRLYGSLHHPEVPESDQDDGTSPQLPRVRREQSDDDLPPPPKSVAPPPRKGPMASRLSAQGTQPRERRSNSSPPAPPRRPRGGGVPRLPPATPLSDSDDPPPPRKQGGVQAGVPIRGAASPAGTSRASAPAPGGFASSSTRKDSARTTWVTRSVGGFIIEVPAPPQDK
ncbi:hypothetical protein L227DRAFT_614457 [Lentinus tigrinus ALCF2SS1-6]|uniref:Uncharacterized protein n=1 Tax=Lentinus tigrinus ALCF2SS1-6 TaxID=1328759 RepID=A0A5C2RZY2_9APHY|nr:hypothetical protein L227DRAFT_614457 [Lentinus tigrinus ALCF2SS1-6]